MTPLFKIDPNCPTPIPVLRVNADGSPREEDGKHFVDVEQAAALSNMSVESLASLWRGSMRDLAGDETAEVVRDAITGEITDVDFDTLSDTELAARADRRQRGNFTVDEWAEFKRHAQAMGYDLDKRECYPRRITNEDTGETEVVAIAKIEVLEDRVLRSGQFDGIDGPWFRGAETNMEWEETWPHEKPPVEAKLFIHRKGVGRPMLISGTWASYAKFPEQTGGAEPVPNRFWWFKGDTQLVKCLRARGFRELFRDVVGKIYIEDEFASPSGSRGARKGRARRSDASHVTEDGDAHRIQPDDNGAAATIAPRTEQMLKLQLTLLGIHIAEQEQRISEARRLALSDESNDPEAFYSAIYAKAAQERRRPQRHIVRPPGSFRAARG